MIFTALSGALLAGFLFLALLGMIELGRRLGINRRARHGTVGEGLGAVEGAVFGLLGLLIAFTFSGAASRFDARRGLIVEEANDIGTAWLRIDVLPRRGPAGAAGQVPGVHRRAHRRLQGVPRRAAVREQSGRAAAIQTEIWALAVPAAQAGHASAPMLFLPAVNAMFDIANTRPGRPLTHPPPVIFVLLISLALCCGLFAGYGMAAGPHRNWLYMLGFSLVLSGAVFVIVDIEFPRLGLIRLDSFDKAIVDVRESMK